MARSFSINENNDIHAINGQLQVSEGITAVLQTCERVMKTILGEMIYSTDRGVNYFESVYGPSPNPLSFEASSRAQLSAVTNVIAIDAFSAQVRNNELVYTAVIRTTFGVGSING